MSSPFSRAGAEYLRCSMGDTVEEPFAIGPFCQHGSAYAIRPIPVPVAPRDFESVVWLSLLPCRPEQPYGDKRQSTAGSVAHRWSPCPSAFPFGTPDAAIAISLFWQHYVDGAEDIAELQDRDHDPGPGQEHVKDMPRVRCSRSPLAHISGRFRLHGLLLGCKMICVSRSTTRLRCRAGWLRKGFCSFVGLEPPIECN